MSRDGGQSLLKFKYNADGIRTNKIVDGANHIYTLNGTQIVSEAWGNFLLIYLYDESGAPIGMQYRTNSYAANVFDTFYFEKNLQGDIIAVYNADGDKIGSYTYDAWGNCTVTVVSGTTTLEKNVVRSYNPFRYRGYYYDTETGLYYLQSRYYNPAWGRFLNADKLISTGQGLLGYNMYAYCNNSPIMFVDHTGTDAIYVSTTEKLPVVGHALVYIQDEQGQWYKTQFAGDFDDVRSARVTTEPVSYRDIVGHLKRKKVNFVYLEGDYSRGAEKAKQYAKLNIQYNRKYDVLYNNCTDYARDILSYGPNQQYLRRSHKFDINIPQTFFVALSIKNPKGSNRHPDRLANTVIRSKRYSSRVTEAIFS